MPDIFNVMKAESQDSALLYLQYYGSLPSSFSLRTSKDSSNVSDLMKTEPVDLSRALAQMNRFSFGRPIWQSK